jgi:hypothetical protein
MEVLGKAVQGLVRRIIEVQVVCKGTSKMGHGFWLEFHGEQLRLDSVFGVPRNCSIREGIEFSRDPLFFSGMRQNNNLWAIRLKIVRESVSPA